MKQGLQFAPIAGLAGPDRRFADFILRQTSYAPGTVLGLHSHDIPIFSFAVAGGTAVSWTRSSDWCEEGSLLYLAAGQPHSNIYPARSVRLHLEVSPRFWQRFAHRVPACSGPIRNVAIPALGRSICSAFHSPDNLSEFSIMTGVIDLIGLLRARGRTTREVMPGRWLMELREFLEAHFAEKLDLQQLATLTDRHPAHISRTFRHHFGRTIRDFVQECRMIRAAKLLRDGTMPLSEVALQCGYYDQSHFTRAFARFMAVTPGQFHRERA